MQVKQVMVVLGAVLWAFFILSACGGQKEEAKPAPEVKAPAVQPAPQQEAVEEEPGPAIDLLKIKEAALKEKDLLMAKQNELKELIAEKAGIPLTAQMGEEAMEITRRIADLKTEVQECRDRYNGYIEQLKAGNVDTSELMLP